MSERATRPLNKDAVKSADDDLYSNHADDPRPNALYDAAGNRKPLSSNDPDQADLRQEWFDSYKANGGSTEPIDLSGAPNGQVVLPCQQKTEVGPIITGDAIEIDETEVPEEKDEPPENEEEPEEVASDEEPELAAEEPEPVAVNERLKGATPETESESGESDDRGDLA